jgi:dihydrofolate reductase
MPKLVVFNHVSVDGYFVDGNGDMRWAHREDAEWSAFAAENAGGGGRLLMGRVTYEMMASYWPTPHARENAPIVAERMNGLPKVVFSRTLAAATWANTKLVKTDVAGEVRKMKDEPGPNLVILGSGTLVSQLSDARLIDEYQIVVNSLALGSGRTLFGGLEKRLSLELKSTRSFKNGNVVLSYGARA